MNWYKISYGSNGIRLWLDDERDPQDSFIQSEYGADGNELWVKTAEEARGMLNNGNVSYISFDHDLGLGESGYSLANWIEEKAFNGELPRLEWRVHSANPVGKTNIERAMISAERFWNRE
jgi:hypothetical protein